MTDKILDTIAITRSRLEEKRSWYEDEILLRFVQITDTHIAADPAYNLPEADYPPAVGAKALVEQVNQLPFVPDFVLHTGDVAFDPDEPSYHAARQILSAIRYPTYYLVGNHDDREMFQRVLLGLPEARDKYDYEFDAKGVQIVCLDSNGPAAHAGGSLTEEQLDWVRATCRTDDPRPLVVAIHHNVLPIGSYFWDTFMRLVNGEALHAALLPARERLRCVLFGHVHMATDTFRDGILYSSANSSWYQLQCYPGQQEIEEDKGEPGFNVVTLTRTQTFIRRHRFKVDGIK